MGFTGDIEMFHKCRNFLQKKGYAVTSAIHIGNNVFEFEEHYLKNGILGIHTVYKIKAFIEKGSVKYRRKSIGTIFND